MRRKITSEESEIRSISAKYAEAAALGPDLGGRAAAADLSRRQDPDCPGNISQAAAASASAGWAALHVWSAFALLMTLVAVPLFSTVLPPLFDYSNHLARLYLLIEGGNAFYAVQWEPLPNLAQDLIVPPLAGLMPLELASKLFLVMVFGLIAGGAIWLNRVATGAWRFWPLLAFLLLYNRIFLWGFVNYLFGIGVALGGIALWLALEPRRSWFRVLVSSVVALLCYFSHVAALGFYALVIFGVEARPAITELRARQWAMLGRRITTIGMQFVLPTVLFLSYWQWTAVGGISYVDFWRKADLVFSVFDNYDRMLDVVCFALFLSLFGWLVWTRRLALVPRLGWAIWILLTSYLLMPSQMYGGSGVDHRLPIAWFLLLIASSAPRFSVATVRYCSCDRGGIDAGDPAGGHRTRLAPGRRGLFRRFDRHRCTAARHQTRRGYSARCHTSGFSPGGASPRACYFTARSLRADPLCLYGSAAYCNADVLRRACRCGSAAAFLDSFDQRRYR